VWIAVMPNCCLLYHERKWAEVSHEIIACVKVEIDCEEGEGLQ
jgi:hypothetical protein